MDLDVCKKISTKWGLPLQFVLKEYAVFDVLSQITNSLDYKKKVVFKGGTALNKVYLGGIQRFSEDLDFDVEGSDLKDAIRLCDSIRGIIRGYEISRTYKVGNSAQFYCKYKTLLDTQDNVRVDVSAKRMITINKIQKGVAKSDYCQVSVSGFLVYSIDDLVARKLNALRCRAEGKDFFDVFSSLDKCKNIKGAIKKLIEDEKLNMTDKQFIEDCIAKIRSVDAKKIMKITNPFIPTSLRQTDYRQMLNHIEYKLENEI